MLARLRDSGAMGLLMSTGPEEGVLWNPVRPSPLPPGRATLVTRAGTELIQVAWTSQ
jgi:S-DNA-T family DNA segregation ATPase FtsK/SpoIIIE